MSDSDPDSLSQPSMVRRLQAAREQQLARPLVGPGLPAGLELVWAERAVITTAPHTFRVTVPIEGPLPSQASVDRIVETIRRLCADGPATRDGCAVGMVRGHARAMSGQRSCLVLLIACIGDSGDCHRDAAHISGLVRNAARRCR